LDSERWARIEDLFHRAADCDPSGRDEFLTAACSDDLELRQQVEALLSSDGHANQLLRGVVGSELNTFAFPLTGKTISHYRILDGLGGGGMGLVYRAQDTRLPRRVAMKFLPEESAKDSQALTRFEREAHSASALEHPNICPIYELGEYEGQPFIVMPLLEGQTVEGWIASEERMQVWERLDKLVDIGLQTAKALEAAHAHGIIHRDIKPANLFLTTEGNLKVFDFGVAKLMRGEADTGSLAQLGGTETTAIPVSDLLLSQPGAALGTAAYMSPEQIRAEKVDARTDLFSLGLVIYEMATGKRAFEGNSWNALQDAILHQNLAPMQQLGIPVKLQQIIEKALRKDREVRYQTASDMRADLEDLRRQRATKSQKRSWALVLGTLLTLFSAAAILIIKHQPKVLRVAPEIRLRRLTNNSSEVPILGGVISPDGKYLAYSDTRGLHLEVVDTGETRLIPSPAELKNQSVKWELGVWFPDSARFLVNAHPAVEDWNEWSSQSASIWAVSVRSGAPAKIREHAVLAGISPDGSTVSFATNRGHKGEREIWFMGPNAERARKFLEVREDNAICCLGWSPDEKRYGYILTDESGDRVVSRDVNEGSEVTLFSASDLKNMNDFVWLHEGRLVYSLPEPKNGDVCNYWTMQLDLRTGKHIEQPRRLTNWPNFCVSSGSVTSDDKKLVFAAWSSFYTSYVADLKGGEMGKLRHFTLEDTDDYISDWMADGKSVVVVQNRKNQYSLYKQKLDSDEQQPIASSVLGGIANYAAVAPDGKWIVAHIWPVPENSLPERPTVPMSIVRIPIAGGPPETILQVSRPSPVSCARRLSGLCVIVEQSEDRRRMIVSAFDPLKGRGKQLASFALTREIDTFVDNLICALSPDGTRVAIARSPEGQIEIHSLRDQHAYAVPAPSLGKLINIVWAADGSGLFITRKTPRGTELLRLNLQGGLDSLRDCTGWGCFAMPSPDGRHLAILDNQKSTNMWMMENF
jgi:serine/threonine protein kinase